MVLVRLIAVLLLASLAVPALAQDNPRVALVIGNAEYAHAPALPNPASDARSIAEAFGRLGFDVTLAIDADFQVMRTALEEFGAKASTAEMAVVFYAGHGMEVGGTNYLIPTSALLRTDTDVLFETIPLDFVMTMTRGASLLSLVILDACRDNPFAAQMRTTDPTRSITVGLAEIEPRGATLVAYAARDGTTAADGPADGHSPFTRALLNHIETPGLEIDYLFRVVRDEVIANTLERQEPWVYGTLGAQHVFLAPPDPTAVGAAALTAEITAFNVAVQINTQVAWEAFLVDFPVGVYANLARLALAGLTATPPVAPPPAVALAAVQTDPASNRTPATGASNVALVLASVNYNGLRFPVSGAAEDARAVSDALGRIGFEVTVLMDLSLVAMSEALADFAEQARQAEIAVVYYTGFGAELELYREFFLLPVDTRLTRPAELTASALSLTDLIAGVAFASRLNLFLIDAPRTDPLLTMTGANQPPLTEDNLTVLQSLPPLTMVVFAGGAGQTVYGGEQGGPFVRSLATVLKSPEVDLIAALEDLRTQVGKETTGLQQPIVYTTLGAEPFYLQRPAAVGTMPQWGAGPIVP